jgi:transcriptional regulator with XRE-family HTH domain
MSNVNDEQRDGSDRAGLARSLRALRESAGLNQTDLATRAGLSQSLISRAERDRRLLSPEQVERVATVCGADPAERDRLVHLARAASREYVDARAILQRGAITHQERVRRFEEDSTLVRAYQPGLVLGQLQSPGYARAIFTQREGRPVEEVDRLVAHRRDRVAMLRDPVRRWEFVQTEGALTWCLGSPAVMAEQMQHLIELSRIGNVALGIVPAFTPARFTAHHGFHLYDLAAVQVGTVNATALLSDRDDVETYAVLFQKLRSLAVFGDDARAVLTRLMNEYRKRGGAE